MGQVVTVGADPRTDWDGWKRERGLLPLIAMPVISAVARAVLAAGSPAEWRVDLATHDAFRDEARALRARDGGWCCREYPGVPTILMCAGARLIVE